MRHPSFFPMTLLAHLVVLWLISALWPMDSGAAEGKKYLEYTPGDFMESLEMQPVGPPPEAEEETGQYNVFLRTISPQVYFVGDEPVKVIYEIYIPIGARVSNLDFRGKLEPFKRISLNTGARVPAPGLRKYEKQVVVLTARLPENRPYGDYKLPSLDISYQYEKMEGGRRATLINEVASRAVGLRKVPLFIKVEQEHDNCLIGDPFRFSLEVHADSSAVVLNEYPPEGSGDNSAYLSGYGPPEPFIMMGAHRQEAAERYYRIIRWEYTVSPHDISDETLAISPPKVMWSREGDIGTKTISPEPLSLKVLGISRGHASFKPMKDIFRDTARERLWLSTIPGLATWGLLASAAALFIYRAAGILRARKEQPPGLLAADMPPGKIPEYDRWVFIRFFLRPRLLRAWRAFNDSPGKESSRDLRSLLARRAAFVHRERRISVQEASAMTASELRGLVGDTTDVELISELDLQLETGRFSPLGREGEFDDII